MEKIIFEVGQKVTCIDASILKNNDVKPPLELGNKYEILSIVRDSKDNQHLNVGLKSNYNWITSIETGEKLPEGDVIHWCHPSRFILAD